jgi:hypothetical protein
MTRWVAVAAVGLGLLLPLAGQIPDRPGASSNGTRVISPVALVTWFARSEGDGRQVADLVVLWRGTPAWFTRGAGGGSSSSGGGGSETVHTAVRYGGLELTVTFDRSARIARIQGKEIQLADANVVFVDGVDGAGGPEVVGTIRVDPALAGPGPRIEPLLRRSPEILSFLRCDVRVPDEKMQAMFDLICAQVAGKSH